MKAKSLAAAITLAIAAVSQASADEVFSYTGNVFTSSFSQSEVGNYLTASVTLNCTVCSAGTYFYGTGKNDISVYTMTADLLNGNSVVSLTSGNPGVLAPVYGQPPVGPGAPSYVMLDSAGKIDAWNISLGKGDFSPGLSSISNDSVYHQVTGDISDCRDCSPFSFATGGNSSPGRWSGPVGAPGPNLGAGVHGLLAALGGYFLWRRRSIGGKRGGSLLTSNS